VDDVHALVELPEAEEAYRVWIERHPSGFVINAWRDPGSMPGQLVGMVWHRADCDHIRPDGSARFVSGDTLKACSLNAGALAVWAKSRGEALACCQSCLAR
jgi:hypothetical protein